MEGEEYKNELIKKLEEEVKEFLEAKNVEELADIVEVIESLKKFPEFTNLFETRMQKLADKGGFEKGFVVKGEK